MKVSQNGVFSPSSLGQQQVAGGGDGMNSVSPSTMPRMIALIQSACLAPGRFDEVKRRPIRVNLGSSKMDYYCPH
jgi:hypothetical protein